MSTLVATIVRSVGSASLLLLLGCDGALVTLGHAPSPGGGVGGSGGALQVAGQGGTTAAGEAGTQQGGTAGESTGGFRFAPPVQLAELGSNAKDENPTFTHDLLRVYFSTTREDGDSNVWSASRASADAVFGNLERVEAVTTSQTETSPAISADGLTLWVGRAASGRSDYDIWRVTRASLDSEWSEPELVPELNSELDDIPRPTALGNTAMPLGSRRDGKYLTYIAVRESPNDPFSAPQLVADLVFDDARTTVDAFLTSDGSAIFFSSSPEPDKSDLYFALRKPGDLFEFEAPVPITDLNTSEYDERDPFLSEDGTRFFFVSNRGGDYEIFESAVSRE